MISSEETTQPVEATAEATANPGAEAPAEFTPEEITACELVQEVLDQLQVTATLEVGEQDDDGLHIDIIGEDLGLIIGKRGQTLHALQYLINTMLSQAGSERGLHVVLDAASYRERRHQALERIALNAVEKAQERGRRVRLDPMPSYERRIIHMVLADHPDVRTISDGEEPYRQVIVELRQRPRAQDRDSGRGRGGGGGRGPRRHEPRDANPSGGGATVFAPRPPAPRNRPQPDKNLKPWDTRIFDDAFADEKKPDQ